MSTGAAGEHTRRRVPWLVLQGCEGSHLVALLAELRLHAALLLLGEGRRPARPGVARGAIRLVAVLVVLPLLLGHGVCWMGHKKK